MSVEVCSVMIPPVCDTLAMLMGVKYHNGVTVFVDP